MSSKSAAIADVLRGELLGGDFGVGAALPSVDELRSRFGVGEYAVRHALKMLRDEGLVSLRQRVGAVVTEKAFQAWKGTIAFVHVGAIGSYYGQKLAQQLSWRFEEAGWRFAPIFIAVDSDGSIDLSQLRRHLANGLSFVVGAFARWGISDMISKAGVPHVILGGYTRDFPNAHAVLRGDSRASYDELINVLKARGVKTILEFDFDRLMDRSFKNQLFEAGFSVKRVMYKFDAGRKFSLGLVRDGGYRAVADFFADERNRRKFPDAILFDDDYLAAGGIAALLEAGIRIPDDVGVVSFMNKGNELVIGRKITGIGCDPAADGDIVAEYVLKFLAGRRPAPPRLCWRYFPGESL